MGKAQLSRGKVCGDMDAWFLGIDLGTGSCKSIVVDEQARVLGFGVGEYGGATEESHWHEQEPEAVVAGMIRAVRTAIHQAGVAAPACRAMSIGGALHSLVAVDAAGRALTGVMTWADGRARDQARAVREAGQGERLYGRTGCPVHAMYPIYKILWLRDHRPEVFRTTARFLSAKEYVTYRLTGEYAVDYSLAAGSGLLDIHKLEWNPDSLELAGITEGQLSPLHSPVFVLNRLDADLSAALGLPQRTPVILGSSDAANSSLGAGAIRPGEATCMIGTSGALRIFSPRPLLDPAGRSWCYAVDAQHWLAGGAINNGGIALSWLRDVLNGAFPGRADSLSFEGLIDLASQSGVGADGLLCLPFFAGERSPHWNENARGVFFGLALHHEARHLARALLEGVAYRLRSVHEVLAALSGDVHQLRASGGFTHSALWLQIVASALNRDLVIPIWGETSSLGASFWAMLGSGHLASLDDVPALVALGGKCSPLPEQAAQYDDLYRLYIQVYDHLRGAFDELATLHSAQA